MNHGSLFISIYKKESWSIFVHCYISASSNCSVCISIPENKWIRYSTHRPSSYLELIISIKTKICSISIRSMKRHKCSTSCSSISLWHGLKCSISSFIRYSRTRRLSCRRSKSCSEESITIIPIRISICYIGWIIGELRDIHIWESICYSCTIYSYTIGICTIPSHKCWICCGPCNLWIRIIHCSTSWWCAIRSIKYCMIVSVVFPHK